MPGSTADGPRLGEILVRRQILTPDTLRRGLDAQARSLMPLGSTLIQEGLADEAMVTTGLAEQFGVPGVHLARTTIHLDVLALLPQTVASRHRVLPLGGEGNTLRLAMANPRDQALIDEMSFASGKSVLPFVAPRGPLDAFIAGAYAARGRDQKVFQGSADAPEEAFLEVLQPPAPEPAADTPGMDPELSVDSLDGFPPPPRPSARIENGPPRVLAVDDEAAILDIIDKALSHKGMEVVRATRGREALARLRATSPDLVLLDAMLPEIHGFEICSQIKRSQQYGHIPVIMISAVYTGWNIIQDVKSMYQADDYVTKPFRVMELVHKVEEILAKSTGKPPSPEQAEAHKSVDAALSEAAQALREGRFEDTLEAAQRAVRADPFDPRSHFVFGTILHRAGRLYEAISEYERVVELAPTQFTALKNLAVLYERQGFKSKALELWMRALNHSPSEAVRKTIKAHLIGLL